MNATTNLMQWYFLGAALLSVEALLTPNTWAAPAQTAPSSSLGIDCGGPHFPSCQEVVSQFDQLIQDWMGGFLDQLYAGKLFSYKMDASAGRINDQSEEYVKAPICIPVKTSYARLSDPAKKKCEAEIENNRLGQTCGRLLPVFPDAASEKVRFYLPPPVGSPPPSPQEPSLARRTYDSSFQPHLSGMIAIYAAHHAHQIRDRFAQNQQVEPELPECKRELTQLQAQRRDLQNIPNLPNFMKNCDPQNLSNCPTQKYLNSSHQFLLQSLVEVARCEIRARARRDQAQNRSRLLEKFHDFVRDECARDRSIAFDMKKTKDCLKEKYPKFWSKQANDLAPLAQKGCGP